MQCGGGVMSAFWKWKHLCKIPGGKRFLLKVKKIQKQSGQLDIFVCGHKSAADCALWMLATSRAGAALDSSTSVLFNLQKKFFFILLKFAGHLIQRFRGGHSGGGGGQYPFIQ